VAADVVGSDGPQEGRGDRTAGALSSQCSSAGEATVVTAHVLGALGHSYVAGKAFGFKHS
jgi:hypothetical protein